MKKDKWLLLGIVCTLLTVFLWGAWWYSKQQTKKDEALVSVNQDLLIRSYNPTLGPDNAPVTVVEFLDPECEACGAMYPTVKSVLKEFDGKVRLVVRYMAFHKNSMYAIGVVEAARKQGKYFEALEAAFASHPLWASHQDPKPQLLLGVMEKLGLDMPSLQDSIKDPESESKARQDQEDGNKLEVMRTPTFFVNGKRLEQVGGGPLKEAIEAALAAH